jgi:hypothetical protein
MVIQNYEGSTNTFTFPHNPNVFDASIDPFMDMQRYKYTFSIIGLANPLMSTHHIVITGHFDGSGKEGNFQDLMEHMNSNQIQQLFFEASTKFYLCLPQQCKKTYSGTRTNFIDYVATFISPFGIVFGSTQKSGAAASTDDNDGNVATPIEKIVGGVTSGSLVTVKDVDGNGFTFTPTGTGTMTMLLMTMNYLGGDAYMTSYIDVKVGTTKQVLAVATNAKSLLLTIPSGGTLASRMTGTGSAVTGFTSGPTFYWRDGWSSE